MRIIAFLLIFCLLELSLNQKNRMVDFTYSQYLQDDLMDGGSTGNIRIFPYKKNTRDYEFPNVCQLHKRLGNEQDNSEIATSYFDVDGHLQYLKSKILELLKLSEKIKKTKGNLNELKLYINKERAEGNSSQFNTEIKRMTEKQENLQGLQGKIEKYGSELDEMVRSYNKNSQSQQFNLSALNFEAESYRLKLSYLGDIRQKAKISIQSQRKVNYTEFFNGLSNKFKEESNLIAQIDNILINFSDVAYLRSKIASLISKIQALNLYIEQKEKCANEKGQNRNRGNTSQIKEQMANLRQKKKQFGNFSNKYCQGVANKLQTQVKKLLKVYNWTYSCAEGIEELQKQKRTESLNLQETQRRLNEIESSGFEAYHKLYNENSQDITKKLDQMKSFNISQYNHNITEIDNLIIQTEQALSQTNSQIRGLPNKKDGEQPVDNGLIKQLVDKIKAAKTLYCHQYEKYEQNAHKLWVSIYKFEQKQKFGARMRSFYIEQAIKLLAYEDTFKTRRDEIIQILQRYHSERE